MTLQRLAFEVLRQRLMKYQITNPLEYSFLNPQSWKTNGVFAQNHECLGIDVDNFYIRINLYNESKLEFNVSNTTNGDKTSYVLVVIDLVPTIKKIRLVSLNQYSHLSKKAPKVIKYVESSLGLKYFEDRHVNGFESLMN